MTDSDFWGDMMGPEGRRAIYWVKKTGTNTKDGEVVLPKIPVGGIIIWTGNGGLKLQETKQHFDLPDGQTACLAE